MHKQNASMGVPNSAIVKGSKKQMISKPQQFNNQSHQAHFGSTSVDSSRATTPDGSLVPDKYKEMLKMAKNKFKSKSEVPNHMLIKGSTSSLGEMDHIEQQAALHAQVNSLQELQKFNYNEARASNESLEFGRAIQGVPLDSDRDRKVSINMHIPSKLSGKDTVPKNMPPVKK